MNFRDAIEALNSVGGIDLMEKEQLEYLIGSNEGNSKLTFPLYLDKYVNLAEILEIQECHIRNFTDKKVDLGSKLTYAKQHPKVFQ